MRTKDWLLEIFTYLLALLFLYTAFSKLIDFKRFVWEIDNQPFGHWLTKLLIYGLPVIELVAVGLLLKPKLRKKGLYLSAILMFTFTGYVALVTFNYYNRVPCSCAGVFHVMTWPQHLIFNVAFTFIAIYSIYLNSRIILTEKNQVNDLLK
jgi:putative oxidoreductase